MVYFNCYKITESLTVHKIQVVALQHQLYVYEIQKLVIKIEKHTLYNFKFFTIISFENI